MKFVLVLAVAATLEDAASRLTALEAQLSEQVAALAATHAALARAETEVSEAMAADVHDSREAAEVETSTDICCKRTTWTPPMGVKELEPEKCSAPINNGRQVQHCCKDHFGYFTGCMADCGFMQSRANEAQILCPETVPSETVPYKHVPAEDVDKCDKMLADLTEAEDPAVLGQQAQAARCGWAVPDPGLRYDLLPPIDDEKNLRSVDVDDIANPEKPCADPKGCPFPLGGPNLPVSMRGLFWLQKQGDSSKVITFGGPTGDAFGRPTGDGITFDAPTGIGSGELTYPYRVRVSGERTWSFGDENSKLLNTARKVDVVYEFFFMNDAKEPDLVNPTTAKILPQIKQLWKNPEAQGISAWWGDFKQAILGFVHDHMVGFYMHLVTDRVPGGVLRASPEDTFSGVDHSEALAAYPGSVIWRRQSFFHGKEAGPDSQHSYYAVQIVDVDGKRIQPAFDKFKEAMQQEDRGTSPGKIWYREY